MFELDYMRIMQIIGYMKCWTLHVVVSLSSLTSKTPVLVFLYSNNLIKFNSLSCFKRSSQWTINK